VPLVMKEKSYTSTPPMGRTACTELQCLYKGDLYLYLYLKTPLRARPANRAKLATFWPRLLHYYTPFLLLVYICCTW